MKNANYTKELTDQICNDYQNGKSVDEIATEISKSVRSVRSKLVREGVYVSKPKTSSSKKADEPTKKELIKDLEDKFQGIKAIADKVLAPIKSIWETILNFITTVRSLSLKK